MSLLLGIDLGTSYFKFGVFKPDGTLAGLARIRLETVAPRPGWRELPTARFWEMLRHGVAAALAEAGARPAEIAGLSYSSHANTTVMLNDKREPLTPLMLWTDTRAEQVPPEFAAFSESETFAHATGFSGVSVESAVTKWDWLRRTDAARWSRGRWLLTISDYFTAAVTGRVVGDASTAALTGLYHLQQRQWWPEALAAFGIDRTRLATALCPGAPAGNTGPDAMALLGLASGVPVAVGALDHHAAAIGAGLDLFAEASLSTGTVLAALCLVDQVAPGEACFHGPHVDGRRLYRLAFNPNGAGRLEQFQERFAPGCVIGDLIAKAARVAPGSNPAGSPWSEEWARDECAAVHQILEAIGREHAALLGRVGGARLRGPVASTGGVARSHEWSAMLADILGRNVVVPACPERACLGAAVFAAVAAGIFPDVAAAMRGMVRRDREFIPNRAAHAAYGAITQ